MLCVSFDWILWTVEALHALREQTQARMLMAMEKGTLQSAIKDLKFIDSQLASMQYNVLRVDPKAGQNMQSHDLWGFFRGDRAPVRGHALLEHKLLFGRKWFDKKVEEHKEQVKGRFLKHTLFNTLAGSHVSSS